MDQNIKNSDASSSKGIRYKGTQCGKNFSNAFSAMTIKDTMMPVISSYHGATTFGQTSPGNASRPYQQSTSPGPNGQEVYNQSLEQSYVQATSPQPSGFQALAINRVCPICI